MLARRKWRYPVASLVKYQVPCQLVAGRGSDLRKFVPLVLFVVVTLLFLNFATGVARADNRHGAEGSTVKQSLDFRSMARELADEVRVRGLAASSVAGSQGGSGSGDLQNVQVNDPALDHIQTFVGTRPFEFSIQSETSIASFGDDILVAYNSASDQPIVQTRAGLFFVHRHLSGFSVSHDRGQTWTSGFMPAVPGSPFTFGDPSVGVDRAGNFYYVSLGTDGNAPKFTGAIIVSKLTQGDPAFAPAAVAALDDGSDKEWLAVGPDPFTPAQDNLYVAWTSFQTGRSELRFVRSTDAGATWSPQKVLFAPVDQGPTGLSSFVQFANPIVDPSSGRLFIPFLHFSNFDADFIKVLVSDDAGDTFRFLEFNVPGAPDPFGFPNVTPGTLSDCGRNNGGIRLVLHQGDNLGGGRFGLPRFRQSTRLITQPSAAAANGKLFIAFTSSTSPFFGDPNSRSEIHLLFSPNGETFAAPFTIAAATDADPQHVLPAISTDGDGESFSVAYYVQQADGRIRVDLTDGSVDGGEQLGASPAVPVSSVSFDLIPSNNPFPLPLNPFFTTNYDRTIRACYNLGEYLSIAPGQGNVLLAWGDNRNTWTSPPGSPAEGTHAQPDVFFQEMSG